MASSLQGKTHLGNPPKGVVSFVHIFIHILLYPTTNIVFCFLLFFYFFFSWPHFCCQVPGARVQLAHSPASPQPAASGTSAPLLAWWPGWWWAPGTLWKLQGCLFQLPSCRWHTHEAGIGVSLTFSLMSSRCLYLASRSNLKNNPWEGI